MQWVGCVGAMRVGRIALSVHRTGALMLLALTGCSGGPASGLFSETRASAIAVDSIDGAPAAVSQAVVRDLTAAAAARQIAVVPAGSAAPYRLRGYLAVHSHASAASVAWVWDVYDTAERRAFRLHGEEPAASGRKAWAAADETVLRRIAHTSVEQLAVFLANPGAPGAVTIPLAETGQSQTLLGRLDDFSPEASGIFRIFSNKPPALDLGSERADAFAAAIPLPPDRPVPRGAEALAFTDSDQ